MIIDLKVFGREVGKDIVDRVFRKMFDRFYELLRSREILKGLDNVG